MADTNHSIQSTLSRRAFVRGATCLAGASLIGLTTAAKASAASPAPRGASSERSPLRIAFWDGSRLVDPCRLSSGEDPLLSAPIRVTVDCHKGEKTTLLGLSGFYHVASEDEPMLAPYHAWVASPYGNPPVAFKIPVDESLSLAVLHRGPGLVTTEDVCRLTLGSEAGPKLCAGAYLIARDVNWSRCAFQPATAEAPAAVLHNGAPATFDCLIVGVQPA